MALVHKLITSQGLRPEIIPSKFAEDLAKDLYDGNLADYPIATAGEKVARQWDPDYTRELIV